MKTVESQLNHDSLISCPTIVCNTPISPFLMDGLNIQLNLKFINYKPPVEGQYEEGDFHESIKGYFDSTTFKIYPDGRVSLSNNGGRISTNGKRILSRLQNKEYDGFNGLSTSDIEFVRKNYNPDVFFVDLLLIIKSKLQELIDFIQGKYPECYLQFKSLNVYDFQICSDRELPIDVQTHFSKIQYSVSNFFGAVSVITENNSKIEYPEYHYKWQVTLYRKKRISPKKKAQRYLKHYMKPNSIRTELLYKSPSIKSKTLDGTFNELIQLGHQSKECLTELLAENDYTPVSIDRELFFQKLNQCGFKGASKSKAFDELYRQLNQHKCYTTKLVHEGLKLNPQQLRTLCSLGILKKMKIRLIEKEDTRFNNYQIEPGWIGIDPSQNKKPTRPGKWMSEKAQLDFAKEALSWGLSELVAEYKKTFDKIVYASTSYSMWKNTDETDELIQLLKSKSA